MTHEEAQAIYRAGEETVVRVLVELSARVVPCDFIAFAKSLNPLGRH